MLVGCFFAYDTPLALMLVALVLSEPALAEKEDTSALAVLNGLVVGYFLCIIKLSYIILVVHHIIKIDLNKKYASTRDWTRDLQIFSLTLSQLSYRGIVTIQLQMSHLKHSNKGKKYKLNPIDMVKDSRTKQ